MRLIIVKETNTILKDNEGFNDLDLSSIAFPENFSALQWYDNNTGHIEYNSPMIQNDEITELPNWVNECLVVLDAAQAAHDAEQAAIKAEIAAQAAQQEASQ